MKTSAIHPISSAPQGPDVQAVSSVLAWACALLAVALPLAVAYHLSGLAPDELLLRAGLVLARGAQPAAGATRGALALLFGLLPVCCVSYGLVCAMRCFAGFAQAEYLSPRTVRCLRGFAAGIFASVVAGLLSPLLVGLVLGWGEAVARRSLSPGFGGNELLTLLFAGMVWQIAAVMARAVALAEAPPPA